MAPAAPEPRPGTDLGGTPERGERQGERPEYPFRPRRGGGRNGPAGGEAE
jgi:hypothetical protein